MVPQWLLSPPIFLAALFFCEGKLGAPPSSNIRDEDTFPREGERSSGAHRRHMASCEDRKGFIKFKNRFGGGTTKCGSLAKQSSRGVNIAKKCIRELLDMDGFGSGATVSDACPVACGKDCDQVDDETTVQLPDTVPTRKPTSNPGQDHDDGEWGHIFGMELIPIHAMVLPEGKVLSYGTNTKGRQRADLYYEVWDVNKGTQQQAFQLLQHSTKTDIFCSTMNVDPSTGNVIIIGGDVRDPIPGLGIETVLEFNTKTHTIRAHPKGDMHYARWYGTSVNLPNGDIFVIGGRSADELRLGSPIPELFSPESGFRTLNGANVPAIANELHQNHWWYPHVYVNSGGHIIVIMPRKKNAHVYRISVEGDGDIERIGTKPFKAHVRAPSIMFRIDEVVMLDDKGGLWVVNIKGRTPTWTKKNNIGNGRTNGSLSLLPDGRVAIMGGAKATTDGGSTLSQAVYPIQIWDPTSNKVHDGPRQERARLYHSSSLILPDGSVLSAGGGAPGPQRNRNGQLYFPDYLQSHTQRPKILACPNNIETDEAFVILVDDTSTVKKVTATKSGASTHTRNFDARWLELDFEVLNDDELRVFAEGKNTMIAGLWMLNTIDLSGVPSVASLVGVNMAPLGN